MEGFSLSFGNYGGFIVRRMVYSSKGREGYTGGFMNPRSALYLISQLCRRGQA